MSKEKPRTVRFFQPEGALTHELVEDTLSLTNMRLRPEQEYTELELLLAYDFGIRCHLRAAGHPTPRRPQPSFVTDLHPSIA